MRPRGGQRVAGGEAGQRIGQVADRRRRPSRSAGPGRSSRPSARPLQARHRGPRARESQPAWPAAKHRRQATRRAASGGATVNPTPTAIRAAGDERRELLDAGHSVVLPDRARSSGPGRLQDLRGHQIGPVPHRNMPGVRKHDRPHARGNPPRRAVRGGPSPPREASPGSRTAACSRSNTAERIS